MLARGGKHKHANRLARRVLGQIPALLAYGANRTQIVMFIEQTIAVATSPSILHGHNADAVEKGLLVFIR